jgi:hypothetical protein
MDAGHYHHAHLDFDEKNVNAQCKQCNGFGKGKPREYAHYLVTKYGPTIFDELLERKKNEGYYSTIFLQEIRDKYKALNETPKAFLT